MPAHEVWGYPRGDVETLRVDIGDLRRKIERDSRPRIIVTVPGSATASTRADALHTIFMPAPGFFTPG